MNFPSGFTIHESFLSEPEESRLIFWIKLAMTKDQIEFDGYRTCYIRYGWDYGRRNRVTQIPEWIEALRPRLPDQSFDAVTVNEYKPPARIKPHIDSRAFGEPILILGLGSDCQFVLSHGEEKHSVLFPQRALMSLSGEARYPWEHSIEPVEKDRYSIVFRKRCR